jgi:hypothetical protein
MRKKCITLACAARRRHRLLRFRRKLELRGSNRRHGTSRLASGGEPSIPTRLVKRSRRGWSELESTGLVDRNRRGWVGGQQGPQSRTQKAIPNEVDDVI